MNNALAPPTPPAFGAVLDDLHRAGKQFGLLHDAGPAAPRRHPVCRVGLGDFSPRPPTDPDVRDYRIRLLESWFR